MLLSPLFWLEKTDPRVVHAKSPVFIGVYKPGTHMMVKG